MHIGLLSCSLSLEAPAVVSRRCSKELARRGYSVVPEACRQLVREQQSIGGVETGSDLSGQLLFSRSMYLYNQAVESLGSGPINADLLQKTVALLPNRGSQQE